MRHVTDGELHAYLDGALDLLPGDRGDEVREHIAGCPVCRERLQDEEQVRSQAKAVLGDPPLEGVALPTFEELRERAAAVESESKALPFRDEKEEARYRGPLRGVPLAWAATIVLALGVGWMGSEIWRGLPTGQGSGPSVRIIEPGPPPGTEMADVRYEEAASPEPESGAEDPEAQAQGSPEETAGPPDPTLQRADRPRGASEPVPDRDAVEEADFVARPAMAAATARGAVPPDSGRLPGVVVSRAEEAARFKVSPDDEEAGLRTQAMQNSLAIPGLKVVSVEWEDWIPGEKVLQIRQLLSPGDTLELRYLGLLLGTETEPRERTKDEPLEETPRAQQYAHALQASLPQGWNQVVMQWGRGLLIARGPVSEGNLKALLSSLD